MGCGDMQKAATSPEAKGTKGGIFCGRSGGDTTNKRAELEVGRVIQLVAQSNRGLKSECSGSCYSQPYKILLNVIPLTGSQGQGILEV